MKTYLLDSIDRFKRYSQSLDVKTILCSKAWYVLNEDGDTENLVFQEDGTVLVSVNGSLKKYTWQYIPQNQSLNIMHTDTDGTMLKPAFLDGKVFAFQKTGTKECMFLIDDALDEQEKILTLDSIKTYLIECEQKAIEQERKLALEVLENEKRLADEKRRKINELKNKLDVYEQQCKELDMFYNKEGVYIYEECVEQYFEENNYNYIILLSFTFIATILCTFSFKLLVPNTIWHAALALGLCGGILIGVSLNLILYNYVVYIFTLMKYKQCKSKKEEMIKKFNYRYFKSISSAYKVYQEKKTNLSMQENEIDKLRKQLKELEDQ